MTYLRTKNYTADQTEEITELSAVVNYIARVSKTVPLNLPDKPWLEPLETAIISPQTDIHWSDEKYWPFPLLEWIFRQSNVRRIII